MASETDSPKQAPKRTRASGTKTRVGAAKRPRTPRRAHDAPALASPAAAGPAGALLEGHVGAQYLLPLLSGGEARGLPGVVVTRVAFQRAGLNHPMDDVVVTGHDHQGHPATLELQAKRTIAFRASDRVFADVVALACRAMGKADFQTTRYELAVAIARTSTTIEQHVQETLRWCREYQDPTSFFARLNQAGTAHQSMRDFVAAFRGHMAAAGAAHEDADVWRLLSRFQVLAFDFEQQGSVCAQLARERCAMQLAPQDVGRAGELWDSLQQIALETDAKGGDLHAAVLRERLTSERDYRLAGDRRLHGARERLAEIADATLATIKTSVGRVSLDRAEHLAAARAALEQGQRYLEIRGAGGAGKSGILKVLAQLVQAESRIVVVAPNRIPGGGWAALKAQLGCEANARELLIDLAGDGGGTLFIDGIDRFDNPTEQQTVVDLLRAAAQVRGFRVVATTRLDFDADAREWLPPQALQELGAAPPLLIPELNEDEKAQLRQADPALAALLAPGHPAEALVSNLYRLDRLVRSMPADAAAPFSEAQMAWQWWTTGDLAQAGTGRVERGRLLQSLAAHLLGSSDPLDARAESAQAIAELIHSGSLRAVGAVRVELAHDVLRDWAIGCLLYEEPERVNELVLTSQAPMRLVRGLELAARLHAEGENGAAGWQELLNRVSGPLAHHSWKRAVLLALARSERALEALEHCLSALSAENAALLGDLVRAAITDDSQNAASMWATAGIDLGEQQLPRDYFVPLGTSWLNLIGWTLRLGDRVPHGAVSSLVNLYHRWCTAWFGRDPLSPLLVARLYQWLVAVEARNHPDAGDFRARLAALDAPGLSMTAAQEADLRMIFLLWCKLCPDMAVAYLQRWQAHPHRHVVFRHLISFVGSAPEAAPRAVADLFMAALPDGDNDRRRDEFREPFSRWDSEYLPASPARAPFLSLLQANKEEGLRLVRGVVAHAIQLHTRGRPAGDNYIEIPLATGRRAFPWRRSYNWSRGHDSQVVASALMALEAWAHLRIEAGEAVQAVIDDVLGPEGSPAAYLLVGIDVMLSHWPKTREVLWPLAASSALLAMDRERFAHDTLGDYGLDVWVHPEPVGPVKRQELHHRPSRTMSLDDVLFHYGYHGPEATRDTMRQALQQEASRLGPPDGESRPTDPSFAAMSALNRLDPANYFEDGSTIVYRPPEQEERLRADLQARANRGSADLAIRGRLMAALTEPPCAPGLLEEGVRWAMHAAAEQAESTQDDRAWIERTRLIVAALILRDGSPTLKAEQGGWARSLLAEATKREADARGFVQPLPYNPLAIAAVGLLAAYRDDPQPATLKCFLHVAARHDAGMAAVLRAELAAQRPLQPELVHSLVRLGLVSAIHAVPNHEDLDGVPIEDWRARREQQESARKDTERGSLQDAVGAELRWLSGEGAEPGWPPLPDPRPPKERAVISLGEPRSRRQRRSAVPREFVLDSAAAARWLSLANGLWRKDQPELLRVLVRHCWSWTAGANGVGCAPDEEAGERAIEWNRAYFAAAVAAGAALGEAGVREYALDPVLGLPEERFFDATEVVLNELDGLWLEDGLVQERTVLTVREALAGRIGKSWPWRRLASECSTSVEIHLASALAAMFMAHWMPGSEPRCYVRPPGAARADVMLPMLSQLATEAAGSAFVARAVLSLLEVDPQAQRLPFMANVVAAWWQAQGANAEFWIDLGFCDRVCAWIESALLCVPVSREVLEGGELSGIVDILVQCGTPLARELEERLVAKRNQKDE